MAGPKIGFSPLKGPDPASGVSKSGLTLAYVANVAIVTVGTVSVTTMQLGLTTDVVSNGVCGMELQGTASQALTIRINVLHSGSIALSFLQTLTPGPNTIGIPFILLNIPAETATWALQMYTDVGTFTMPVNFGSWWIESGAIEGGLIASDPSSTILEPVNTTVHTIVEVVTEDIQTPIERDIVEAVDSTAGMTITDLMTVSLANTVNPTAGSDDGFYSPTTFNTTAQTTQVGVTAADVRGSWWRFDLPEDLGGATIDKVFLDLIPDANMSTPVQLKITAALDANPSNPANYADAGSRTRTVANLTTSVTTTAGNRLTFDITALLAEVAAGAPYGGFLSFLVFMDDNGSPSEALLQLRSRDYSGASTSQPALRISFHDLVAAGFFAGYSGGF